MRRFMALVVAATGIGLAAFGLSPVTSAGTGAVVKISFTIMPAQTLSISVEQVDFGVVSPGVSTPGQEVVLTVESNTDYRLFYTATEFTDGTERVVPVGRLSADGGHTPLGHCGLVAEGGPTDGARYRLVYVLKAEMEDPSGTFTGEVTYILAPR
jgi:hypothetical protein